MADVESVGQRVKVARRGLDLSQAELGRLAGGRSQAWVSRIEKGSLSPTDEQLAELEAALGSISPSDNSGTAEGAEVRRGPAAYKAARIASANQKRRAEFALRLGSLQAQEKAVVDSLTAERERAGAFVEEFFHVAGDLPDSAEAVRALGTTAFTTTDADVAGVMIDVRNRVVEQVGIQLGAAAAAGSTLGAVTGGALAFGAYTAVGAFATASTGTAISALSGAAASSATLAFLGGGSLAAGGLGVAGGTALLTGIVAAPALLAAGVALAVTGRKLLVKAEDERTRLLEAGLELDRLEAVVGEYCGQAELAETLLAHSRTFGERELKRIRRNHKAKLDVEAFGTLTMLVAVIYSLLPLPVPGESDESSPLGRTRRANEIALDSAEEWLFEVGALAH